MKHAILAFGTTLIVLACVFHYCLSRPGKREAVSVQQVTVQRSPIGAVLVGSRYVQAIQFPELIVDTPRLVLGLRGATYQRKNPGTITIDLRQGSEHQRFIIDVPKMKDNSPVYFDLVDFKFQPGPATLEIYSKDNDSSFGATFWAVSEGFDSSIERDGSPLNMELIVDYYQRKLSKWRMLINRIGSPISGWFVLLVICAGPAWMVSVMLLNPDCLRTTYRDWQ